MVDTKNPSMSGSLDSSLANETTSITLVKSPGCHVHIEATVTPLATQAGYEKAFKNVKKEVSLPGFRKGKAPDNVVLQNFASQIDREWRTVVLRTAFNEALQLSKLKPFSDSSVKRAEVKKCSKEEGSLCVFDFESEPEVPDVDPTSLNFEKKAITPVTEQDIDHEVKNVQLSRATWEEIQDRPCQVGDYVEVDVDIIENPAKNLFSDRLFHLEKDEMPEWMFDLVPGLALFESREAKAPTSSCSSQDPDHKHGDSCAESTKECRVTLKKIKKATLPEANDEFAKQIGFDTIEAFRSELQGIITSHRNESVQEQERLSVYGQIIEQYSIDVPDSLVQAEAKSRFEHIKKAKDLRKGDLPLDKEREKLLKAQIDSEARGFFICLFILQKLAGKQRINVSKDELMNEYTLETVYVPYNQRLIYPGMEPEEIRSRLYTKVLMRKAIDYLINTKGN